MNTIEEPHTTEQAKELAALNDEQHQLELATLERACKAAAPLVPHLGTHPQRDERTFWPDSSCSETETTAFKGLAIHLLDDTEAYQKHPRGQRGKYAGSGLWLDSEGQLRLLTYAGIWSRWQGEASSWKATASTVTPADALERWELGELLAALEAVEKRGAELLPGRIDTGVARIAQLRRCLSGEVTS